MNENFGNIIYDIRSIYCTRKISFYFLIIQIFCERYKGQTNILCEYFLVLFLEIDNSPQRINRYLHVLALLSYCSYLIPLYW